MRHTLLEMSDQEPPGVNGRQGVTDPARRALGRIRSGVAAARDPLVDRVGQAVDGAGRTWSELPGARVRRVRRMGRTPLPSLYDLHPEARSARAIDIGLETIDVADIAGTAVGGGDQRGGDFLLLPDAVRPWLRSHPGFKRHLDSRYRCARSDEACAIYDLTGPAEFPLDTARPDDRTSAMRTG